VARLGDPVGHRGDGKDQFAQDDEGDVKRGRQGEGGGRPKKPINYATVEILSATAVMARINLRRMMRAT
jgi:hypothetical protein